MATEGYNEREARVARENHPALKTQAELERIVYAFTEDHPDTVKPPCHCGMDELIAPGVYICVLHGKRAEREAEQREESR